jgi:uncharacterized protein YpuA (DUF1002 family)
MKTLSIEERIETLGLALAGKIDEALEDQGTDEMREFSDRILLVHEIEDFRRFTPREKELFKAITRIIQSATMKDESMDLVVQIMELLNLDANDEDYSHMRGLYKRIPNLIDLDEEGFVKAQNQLDNIKDYSMKFENREIITGWNQEGRAFWRCEVVPGLDEIFYLDNFELEFVDVELSATF